MDITIDRLNLVLGTRQVLSDVTLTIGAGELVAIVGPNGAGKSSLMRAIAGDVTPTSGSVTIDGRNISSLAPQNAAAVRSYLSQTHAPASGFTVETIVGFGQHVLARSDADAVRDAMDRVELTELSGRPFDELSGGEQRRVTIARVLCQDAPVVLLDEPTDSLDLGHAELVMAVAADEARRGKTVVTTSHDLNVAARHATKMVLLSHGRTVKVGTPSEVLEPGILSEVYATTVTVIEHPASGLPVVVV
jgi:iron complex transport system ATP-binding protein